MEFILERYNYWIVIILMMTGLYMVFARGNLVKKIVGLNVFQTSVFIFYITIGKIAGGTAPIYIGGELDHGGGHGETHDSDDHGADSHGAGAHDAGDHGESAAAGLVAPDSDAAALGEAGRAAVDDGGGLHSKIENVDANELKGALNTASPDATGFSETGSLHADVETSNKILNEGADKPAGFDVAGSMPPDADHAGDYAAGAVDHAATAGEVIYSNPLPHVLILTAIVVGIATTAVGLALAVRIREAYGTIEEDELEAIDNVAEFGAEAAAEGASS